MTKTWFVTGGAGFIGSNFVLACRRQKLASVITIDKLTYAGNPENLASLQGDDQHTLIQADIRDQHKIEELLEVHKPDTVVHFAAESHVDRSIDGPADFIQTNLVGTFSLLEACRNYLSKKGELPKDSFRFLHVSTDEVFGSLKEEDPAFHEQTPYAPNSPYSASKAGSDFLVRAYYHTYGLPVLTTNCSNNYGPFQFPEKLIPLVIIKALAGESLPVYGDGLNIRDWLFVEDHVDGILTVLQRGQLGETYNIGGNSEKRNIDVVHEICDLLDEMRPRSNHQSYRELIQFVKDRPGHDRRYAMDASKMKNQFSWVPRSSFSAGLRQTIGWFLENETWWKRVQDGRYQGERLGVFAEKKGES